MDPSSLALVALGRALVEQGYRFVTPTPETQRRVVARRTRAEGLRDVFGWNLQFAPELLPSALFELLVQADALTKGAHGYRSKVRFSSLEGGLYVHSAYPTLDPDSVFFGPDTYRFCSYLRRTASAAERVLDLGCGSGAGGLVAADAAQARELVLSDINPRALALAEVNAALAGRSAQLVQSDLLAQLSGEFDLVVANPPYMRDAGQRVYRDGGGEYGEQLSVRIVAEVLPRLRPGGSLLLYTGVAVVEGADVFWPRIEQRLVGHEYTYEELDPDVFGEELERPGYERVERLAAVALRVVKPRR